MIDFADTMLPQARKQGIHLELELPKDAIPTIRADADRVRQMLTILTDNALRYTPEGTTVTLKLKAAGEGCKFCVSDHGPGIPETEIAHVKERFFKGSTHVRGNGIGLAVCDEIVSRHGGELLIANADGGGLIVTVKLPVGDPMF